MLEQGELGKRIDTYTRRDNLSYERPLTTPPAVTSLAFILHMLYTPQTINYIFTGFPPSPKVVCQRGFPHFS